MKSQLFSHKVSLFCTLTFITAILLPIGETNATPGYDTTRIYQAMAKARRGEAVTIGFIGGSITQGTAASTESKRWANLVYAWWVNKFPQSRVSIVNAGIGGTGSDVGTHRIIPDLLSKKPDFVMVEFSVNDTEGEYAEKMMEGLVRQVLDDSNKPGLMLLMLKQSNGITAQESHKPVASHYLVPYVSFADLIDSKVASDGVSLESIFTDGLHPNDKGMNYIAGFIKDELDSIYKNLPFEDSSIPEPVDTLPLPLVTDVFAHTYRYYPSTIVPLNNSGWTVKGSTWECSTPGSELVFEVDGNAVSIQYARHNGADWGRAEVWIDNGTPVTLDAYWNQTWGPATVFQLIAENLSDGVHTLHIKILDSHDPASTGNYFRLLNVLKAGNIGSAAPIAVCESQKKSLINTNIDLNGSASYDPDGETISSFAWQVTSAPPGANIQITGMNNPQAVFSGDKGGNYVVSLTVTAGGLTSVPKKVYINLVESNTRPVAVTGSDLTVATRRYPKMNGSQSYDADGDSLNYLWTLISKPVGSTTQLVYENTLEPAFKADVEGEYIVTLVVNDSLENSLADTLIVTAIDNYSFILHQQHVPDALSCFPVPTSDKFSIKMNLSYETEVKILLFGIDGKLISILKDASILNEGTHQFEFSVVESGLLKGTYLIKAITGRNVYTEKLIVF